MPLNDSINDLKKEYGKLWLFITGISAIFLVLCVLAARFFASASNLLSFGLVYLVLLLLGLVFWNGTFEDSIIGDKFWESLVLSIIVFFGISYAFAAITKNFSLITWSLIPTESLFPTSAPVAQSILAPIVPNTIHLAHLSFTTQQAKTGLALFFNIPGPFAEEMGFRIFMWKIAAPLIGTKKAILFQAGGFGVLHFFAYGLNWPNIILAVIVGALIGFIYRKYNNELAIGSAHFGFNVSSIIVAIILGIPLTP